MTINNKGNLFVFEVGPSVKFVSAIKDAIFKKKNGGNFFVRKNAKLLLQDFSLSNASLRGSNTIRGWRPLGQMVPR